MGLEVLTMTTISHIRYIFTAYGVLAMDVVGKGWWNNESIVVDDARYIDECKKFLVHHYPEELEAF